MQHCANIGLKPTIITHAQGCTETLVRGVEDAGLEDWLVSLHGMQEGHDRAVVNHSGNGAGGWERLTTNLANMTRPVRFNCTVTNFNYQELPDHAQWLVDNRPPTVINYILFNPFYAWHERPEIDFQEKQSTLAPYIGQAVNIAEREGWEVNVRYFNPCIAEPYGFAQNCIGFFQTQFDNWEWSLAATNRFPLAQREQVGGSWHEYNMAHCRAISAARKNDACQQCRFYGTVCEGPQQQYLQRYGTDELNPSIGEQVLDPLYFEKGGAFQA